jgi:hypothetical protein
LSVDESPGICFALWGAKDSFGDVNRSYLVHESSQCKREKNLASSASRKARTGIRHGGFVAGLPPIHSGATNSVFFDEDKRFETGFVYLV